jgi:hypothetical protein
MTKPADSERTAKAREQLRTRAQTFAVENGWASEDDPVIKDLMNFAESERSSAMKEAREECARIADRLSKNQTNIRHPDQRMTVETTAQSIAAAIRALGSEK